ncbi:MAG TPA: HlyC/CorC family transporter [Pseudomonadaceae bacterium]|nr:HlyC/CorC family transporter [Pseudomonadaceae bacterium]
MNHAPLELLFLSLVVLILCSAYFAGSEMALMSLNRYRLRHMVDKKHKGALRASKLLGNPDKLISILLIGNNFVTILASSIATIIAIRLWGDSGVIIASLALTFVILIFAELTPKTVAALHPESIAYPSSLILIGLLKVFHPLVVMINTLSRGLARLLGCEEKPGTTRPLSSDELRRVANESSRMVPRNRQAMLFNVLDLEKITVTDVMVPRNEVVGVDLEDDLDAILDTLANSSHTRLPVFSRDLNNVLGILHIRSAARLMVQDAPNKAELLQLTRNAYFVPETTPLTTQLVNFQQHKRRIALVVDEYGDVRGIVTLEDILEEIVGNFSPNLSEETPDIHPQSDGSYLIEGSTPIREINRTLQWELPTDGPKTLSGLLTELLESIPDNPVGIRLPQHYVETIQVKDKIIKTVRMWATDINHAGTGQAASQTSLFD